MSSPAWGIPSIRASRREWWLPPAFVLLLFGLSLALSPAGLCSSGEGDTVATAAAPPSPSASSEATGANAEREVVEQLLAQVQALQARVAELEMKESLNAANAVVTAPVGAAASGTAAGPASSPNSAPSPFPPDINEVAQRIHLNAYADMGYAADDQGKGTNSFTLGSLDLFLTSRLTDKASVMGEFILLAQPDNKVEPDLERLMFQYKLNDYFTFGIGRYHTDIGYYNATFHHIQWFATPVDRPLVFHFDNDGGFMPLQEIGLSMNGNIPSGKLGLHWVAEVGNGRDHNPADEPAQNSVDTNHGKAFNINLSSHPAWFPGLITGFSFYHDDITMTEFPKVGQSIMDAYVVYQKSHLEWLNEFVDIRDAVNHGRTFHAPAGYIQISYGFGKYRPYLRYGWENSNSLDFILNSDLEGSPPAVSRQNDVTGGLRIDINDFAALKVQYDRFTQRSLSAYDEFQTQVSFSF